MMDYGPVLVGLLALLATPLSILGAVFFGVAAYQDAKSLNRSDATMWGLLIGFLGLIPGIIYLCVRKNAPRPAPMQQVCIRCRTPLYPGAPQCPACGAAQPPPAYPAPTYYYPQAFLSPEQCAQHHRLAKKFLITAIVLTCAVVVAIIAMWGIILGSITSSIVY